MKKHLVLTFLIVAASWTVCQNPSSVQANRQSCKAAGPTFRDWVHRTQVAEGKPYRATAQRKNALFTQYSKLRLRMSQDEVEKLLGTPSFGLIVPEAHLTTSSGPVTPQCMIQTVYLIGKDSADILDETDVGIYLTFSGDGKLSWSSPRNLPQLTSMGAPPGATLIIAPSWKEYIFENDGFGITLPAEPVPHPDAATPDMTVYSVSAGPATGFSLRVSHRTMDCAATLTQLRDGGSQGKSGIDPASVKDLSIGEFPGLEYRYEAGSGRAATDRFYCVKGKFYTFSSSWPGVPAVPANVVRIMDSFRLLNQ